jgi:hypothetical protein
MRVFRWIGLLLVVLGFAHAAILRPMTSATHPPADEIEPRPTDSWDQRLESQGKESRFVVQGRITQVESNEHPEAKTISLGTIEVTRHLKNGVSDLKTIPVEFRFDSYLDMTPDTEDVIWFVRERQSNGRYLVTDWKWGLDSLDLIMAAVARVDRTPIPNMPKPRATDQPISVVLAADDGQGRASTEIGVRSFEDNRFLIQFENHGRESLTVMTCLYGSLWRSKYPHYDLEIVDEQGQRIPLGPSAVCGTCEMAPLQTSDIVSIEPGEVFKTTIPHYMFKMGAPALEPGTYKVRLRYTAKRDVSVRAHSLRPSDQSLEELMKLLWEGAALSNWVTVHIEPKSRRVRH